jgi:hypothetical protein
MGFAIAGLALVLPRSGVVNPAGIVGLILLCILFLSFIIQVTVILANWPKFLVPPHMRSDKGVWSRGGGTGKGRAPFRPPPAPAAVAEAAVEDGSPLLLSGLANHFRGTIADGGRLALSHTRLVFTPHSINLNTEPRAWRLTDIESVSRASGWPPILVLRLHGGGEERFRVYRTTRWISCIDEARL